ncbi:MAG: endolytic transglycosylase MltG [Rikenellaceae bacterium]
MKKTYKIIGAVLSLVAVIAIGFVVVNGMLYYNYAFKEVTLKEGVFFVPTGTTHEQQIENLVKEGFVSDSVEYAKVAEHFESTRVRPGKYTINKGLTYKDLFAVIVGGRQTPVKVTFNNIRDDKKMASVISKYIEADSIEIIKAIRNDTLIEGLGFDKKSIMGLFIPNTYEFYWNTSGEDFLRRMKKEYDRFWSSSSREERLDELGLTKQDVSTLASIVIEESKYNAEMPRIAGVYMNRLKIGMPLQADPTVKFALGDPSIKRVLLRHLEVNSPYNTYKNAGLPPGVICTPPIVAIDAVLNAEEHSYYYFCADSDLTGKHIFAKSLSEHTANARKYAAELNKRGIR